MRLEVKRNYFNSDRDKVFLSGEEVAYDLPVCATLYTVDCTKPLREQGSVRLRFYVPRDCLKTTTDNLIEFLKNNDVKCKVEYKRNDGTKIQLGELTIRGCWDSIQKETSTYILNQSYSNYFTAPPWGVIFDILKISDRRHFLNYKYRITQDEYRYIFKFLLGETGDILGTEYLGDLGPRIEIKSEDLSTRDLNGILIKACPYGFLTPFSSLELVCKSHTDRLVSQDNHKSTPEIEAKLTSKACVLPTGSIYEYLLRETETLRQLILEIPNINMLLNGPCYYSRTRKYHICLDRNKEENTVVETASGKLSLKKKRLLQELPEYGILVRDCKASSSTHITGFSGCLEEFIRSENLTYVTSYIKHQCKMPFSYKHYAFCLSVDVSHNSLNSKNMLNQIEFEYIGSIKKYCKQFNLREVLDILKSLSVLISRKSDKYYPDITEKTSFHLQHLNT